MSNYHFKEYINVIQSVATIIAIIIGGMWGYFLFIKRRQKYPRANLTQRIFHKIIGENKILLHIDIDILNIGDVLLSLKYCENRVQQVVPIVEELMDKINHSETIIYEGESEVRWPMLQSKRIELQNEIEPNEVDQISFDYIIEDEVEIIEIYSHFRNQKKRRKEIGWNISTIYNLKES